MSDGSNSRQYLLFLGIILTIAIIPIVQAVTEPNIIIDMVTSQTTSPFVIKNSTGANVFEISPNGTISPLPTNPSNNLIIEYNSATSITSDGDEVLPGSPKILWQYHINRNEISTTMYSMLWDMPLISEVDRISGVGTCFKGMLESTDNGTNWSESGYSFSWTTATNLLVYDGNQPAVQYSPTTTDIAFAMWSSDGSTVCEISNITSYAEYFGSILFTMERVI